jgi:hypothetical protein
MAKWMPAFSRAALIRAPGEVGLIGMAVSLKDSVMVAFFEAFKPLR